MVSLLPTIFFCRNAAGTHALPLIISLEIDLACGQLKCVCIINDPLPCGDVASKIEMYCFKVVLVSAKK